MDFIDCSTCDNCICLGEGNHYCEVNESLVLDEYEPTDDYCWCDGEYYS